MPFAVQTINSEIAFDFGFQLNQFSKSSFSDYKVVLTEVPLIGHIPIGSVEFAHKAMEINSLPIPHPVNIPHCLNFKEITRREISYTEDSYTIQIGSFVKSTTKIKDGFTGILYNEKIRSNLPKDLYLVSEFVDYESEWRVFVLDGKVLDVRQYLGSYRVIPNFDLIDKIICMYSNQPIAYTIDVGICNGDTSLIEIHNFYSCGLYGFSIRNSVRMWVQWWNEYRKNSIVV